MGSPLVAPGAELLVLHATGLLLLVLRRGVVAALAGSALECDDITHFGIPCSSDALSMELATGIEPVTSSLPRKCSTN